MDLKRRLTLYLFGLVIGGGVSYMIYGERLTGGAWLPEQRVKLRLINTLTKESTTAHDALASRQLTLQNVREAMPKADILFSESRRTDDSLIYMVNANLGGKPARLVIGALRNPDKDSTATLLELR